MNILVHIKDQIIKDNIICAFEGGSNYWMELPLLPKDYFEIPFRGHQGIKVIELVEKGKDIEKVEHVLDAKSIKDGLSWMADKSPHHFADMIAEDGDSNTADVFLQFCVLGCHRYG